MLLVQTLEEIIVKEISDYNGLKKNNSWGIIGKKIMNMQKAINVVSLTDKLNKVVNFRVLIFWRRDVIVQVSNIEMNGLHCFLLKYDCSTDKYHRCFNIDGDQFIDGWQSLTQSSIGVARITEKNISEFAYIGSNDTIGQICWRIEHPKAKVARVDVCLKGMSTTDEIGDKDAKIGVNVFCGDQGSRRAPAAIPVNSQIIDVIEMEKIGKSDFTEQKELVSQPLLQKQTHIDEKETFISLEEEKNVKLYSSFSEVKITQNFQQQQIITSEISSTIDLNKVEEIIDKLEEDEK
uniref:Uncharacterized protein n=1 Tax=Meloidogyne hapla TaxID=6305 RepID=A0A1I8BVE2_MELHA